jgi:hypothetical protein
MEDLEKLRQLEQKREAMGETLQELEQSQQVSITPYIPYAPHAPQQLQQHTYDPLVSPLVQPELVQSHTESTTLHTPQQLQQLAKETITEELKESEAEIMPLLRQRILFAKESMDEVKRRASVLQDIFDRSRARQRGEPIPSPPPSPSPLVSPLVQPELVQSHEALSEEIKDVPTISEREHTELRRQHDILKGQQRRGYLGHRSILEKPAIVQRKKQYLESPLTKPEMWQHTSMSRGEELPRLMQNIEIIGEELPELEQSYVELTEELPEIKAEEKPELVQSQQVSYAPYIPQRLHQHTHNPLVSPLVHPVLIQSRDELTEEFKESEASKKLVTLKSQLRTFKKQYDDMRKQAAAVTAIFSKHKRR